MSNLKTPVAFLIFNRPETTQKVFEQIRLARPEKLLIVADGPRNEKESNLCKQTRDIVEKIDWPCQVLKNYSEVNLGCKDRVSSGLTWVFENVDRAIVLEDDCLPHPTFFSFCEELLEKYKDDRQVMHISGDNFQAQNPKFKCTDSYYFSNISHIWGWASWSRAWKYYDVNLSSWPEMKKKNIIKDIFKDEATADRWEDKFDQYYAKKINSWDGQWSYACLVNHGLCIMPKVNLISNIGFGQNATHTTLQSQVNSLANLPSVAMNFPLIHPKEKMVYKEAADYISDLVFGVYKYRSMRHKTRRFMKNHFPRLYLALKKL